LSLACDVAPFSSALEFLVLFSFLPSVLRLFQVIFFEVGRLRFFCLNLNHGNGRFRRVVGEKLGLYCVGSSSMVWICIPLLYSSHFRSGAEGRRHIVL
jgi:hypothetical protein